MDVNVLDVQIDVRIKARIQELNASRPRNERITIVGIAKAIGRTTDYMFKIMKGKIRPSQTMQFAIAHILECPVEYIFLPTISTKNLNDLCTCKIEGEAKHCGRNASCYKNSHNPP